MICYIPSKSRPKTKTHELFELSGISVIHFVEPKEENLYSVNEKVVLPENDQGISYVRNFMLDYARARNHKMVIICDDDVTSFGSKKGSATVKCKGADIFHEIKASFEKTPFEMAGVNYKQYCWAEEKKYSINTALFEVCVVVKPFCIKWNYRSVFNTKEDRDFLMQTVINGNGVLKFNHFYLSAPKIGSNKGGLNEDYKNNKHFEAVIKMKKHWGDYVDVVKKGKDIDLKYKIKKLAQDNFKFIK